MESSSAVSWSSLHLQSNLTILSSACCRQVRGQLVTNSCTSTIFHCSLSWIFPCFTVVWLGCFPHIPRSCAHFLSQLRSRGVKNLTQEGRQSWNTKHVLSSHNGGNGKPFCGPPFKSVDFRPETVSSGIVSLLKLWFELSHQIECWYNGEKAFAFARREPAILWSRKRNRIPHTVLCNFVIKCICHVPLPCVYRHPKPPFR